MKFSNTRGPKIKIEICKSFLYFLNNQTYMDLLRFGKAWMDLDDVLKLKIGQNRVCRSNIWFSWSLISYLIIFRPENGNCWI